MATMIETIGLGRYFGEIKAVDGITFSVSRGEVLGFLGPNGAGKSTTMKMLTCFLTPSFGEARVGGHDIVSDSREVRKLVGYLPENAPLYGDMEVRELLEFVSEVRGIEADLRRKAVDRAVELTSLGEVVHQRIETLSKGFKRRVGLAQALIHDPEILILDEPTDGLDPNQKHEVRQLIRSMAQEKCILLSTHILEEVDEVCTRVVIIAQGKIVADELPDKLRKRSTSAGAVYLTLTDAPPSAQAELEQLDGVGKVEAVARPLAHAAAFVIYPQSQDSILLPVMSLAQRSSWKVTDLHIESGKLDEVFRAITR